MRVPVHAVLMVQVDCGGYALHERFSTQRRSVGCRYGPPAEHDGHVLCGETPLHTAVACTPCAMGVHGRDY